ncbi:MAG: Gfo/Idh/MocA family oxidoreductase [Acidobacteriota bacterium]
MEPKRPASEPPTRRRFIAQSLAAGAALGTWRPVYGRADEEIRIGLIGAGGRGTGAAVQALSTEGPVKLVAVADAFSDRLERSLERIVQRADGRVEVPASARYAGFDGYQKVLDRDDVDLVILATPPGFRPEHFEASIEAGKHVFMEKPVAVDAPGVRRVLATADVADSKGLRVGVGLQRHHDALYLETLRRLHAGDLGDLVALRVYWNSDGVWVRPRKSDMTEMEYQMRNWYYFNWLCGDHIVEQHIHNIDVGNWAKKAHPVKAQGQGGRQTRNGREHGEIYDHHFVEFTYADGSTMLSQCRHMKDCWNQVGEFAHGTAGTCNISEGFIQRADGRVWHYDGEPQNPFQVEHDDLFSALRNDEEFNEARRGAEATMSAILGRMATYSGQEITWEQAMESKLSLAPERMAWDASPPSLPDADGRYAIAMPGKGQAL